MEAPAVILLSGGLDSATTLAIARDQGFRCHALSFDYGQRHRFELKAAQRIAQHLGAAEHLIMTINLRAFGGSALTADIDVPHARRDEPHSSIPITYVPARNTIFLAFALALAEVRSAADIFIGVSAIDYSGYPDCRPDFIDAFERTANLATRAGVERAAGRESPLRIHAPLINLSKAQTIERGLELGVDYSLTHSCYDPDLLTGSRCGSCESCTLRAAGFRALGMDDPAEAR